MQHATSKTSCLVVLLTAGFLPLMLAAPVSAGTLDRIRESGKVTLGYRADARPFSYQDESGKPAGYSIELCQAIADGAKTDLGLSALSVEWIPVTIEDRFQAIKDSKGEAVEIHECPDCMETLQSALVRAIRTRKQGRETQGLLALHEQLKLE